VTAKGPDPLPTYIVFVNRKKRHDETLDGYYQAITLGTLDAPNPPQALKIGATTFHQNQITIDVVSLARASIFQKQIIERRQKESQQKAHTAQPRTTSRSRSAGKK
jgi:1,2-phenylacetyl-CoA epoxidase PaaB subunit